MIKFCFAMTLTVTAAFVFWLFFFYAIDKHMAEQEKIYQECGGAYCPLGDKVDVEGS